MSREIIARAMDDMLIHLGVDAVYTGQGLSPINIRVLKFASDVEYETGDVNMVGEKAKFEILIQDVANPIADDTINIDGTIYQIIGLPLRNLDRKSWDVEGLVIP
ncbi:MAG: hypothetical protein O2942_09145 [Proteobacteria bacterium]|nr:hypothetical protein [Pseudomonadota bacterium]